MIKEIIVEIPKYVTETDAINALLDPAAYIEQTFVCDSQKITEHKDSWTQHGGDGSITATIYRGNSVLDIQLGYKFPSALRRTLARMLGRDPKTIEYLGIYDTHE